MDGISALVSSIICGRCKTTISYSSETNGVKRYSCKCLLKFRVLLNCEHCKKPFLNLPYLIRKTNYCSLECYWIGTKRKKLKICKECGKEFLIKSYLIKQGFGFYCSKSCWFSVFKKQRKIIKCKECQKERSVYKSVYAKHPKFCSKKCSDNSKIDNIFRICRMCTKNFKLTTSALNRGRGSFCTWECYKKFKGETSIERLVRLHLQRLKEPFQQEVRIGKFRADFYVPRRNLVIECDGKYWHGDIKIKERDKRKDNFLSQQGYLIVRLPEDEIRQQDWNSLESLLSKD